MDALTRDLWQQQDRHTGDRLRLFSAVQEEFALGSALYPGSFVDIAASFVIDDVTYVDSDRRAARFFADVEGVDELIAAHRSSSEPARWRFVASDFREQLPVADASVDLLVSLYAGLVTDHCEPYLAPGGLLLANTSHGDASVVALSERFELVAAVSSRGGRYRVRRDGLDRYLRPTRPEDADADLIRTRGRGIAYTTSAFAYVFERRRDVASGSDGPPDGGG